MGGVILDSSVLIRGERQRIPVETLLGSIRLLTDSEAVGLSAIGVPELMHGIYRAESTARAQLRQTYLEALIFELPVYPYTLDVARLAGKIDGEQTKLGNTIPFIDLLIGVTALSLGFSLLTTNMRHFQLIPGLDVIPF